MKILVIGATGTLGRSVVELLGPKGQGHEIVQASRSGEVTVDIREPDSIRAMYAQVGTVDAIAVAAGGGVRRSLQELTYEEIHAAVADKVLGQMELVRQGIPYVSDGGSFTLVSGVTSSMPIRHGSVMSAANAAVDGFVVGSASDLPRSQRINSVSASVFREALATYDSAFPGFNPVSTAEVARVFRQSIEGVSTGHTFRVGY